MSGSFTGHQQHVPPYFGLIAATSNLRTDFVPVPSTNNTKFTLTLTSPGNLPSPITLVNELVVFFLPGTAAMIIPPNSGALIYWQVEISPNIQSGYELLGCLEPVHKPSDVFRTAWSSREEFVGLAPDQNVKVNIGIEITSMDVIKNLTQGGGNMSSMFGGGGGRNISPSAANGGGGTCNDKRPIVAHKIAEDLFNFMQSFDTGGATGNQTMVVPANIFDRWLRRFQNKLQRDPNFLLRKNE